MATRDPAFEEWLAFERRRLKDLAIAVLGKLLLLQLEDPSADAAVATARRLLELDEADEGAHRALMRLHARRGERNAALRQYQLCRTVLARELGPSNIRVNTLAPGSTMSEDDPSDELVQEYERIASRRVLKRVERPEDVVGTALYLVSDLSAFVTGQVILVNGGAVFH